MSCKINSLYESLDYVEGSITFLRIEISEKMILLEYSDNI